MGTFKELKERRLFQVVASYAAAGWIVLEVVSQVVERELLPPVVYNVTLLWFLAGFVAACIIGWNHGEKGHQTAPTGELWVLGLLFIAVVAASGRVVSATSAGATPTVDSAYDASRIAVLYLDDVSTSGDLAYLADGLTEAVIQQLAGVRTLDVVSRNGVAPFQGTTLAYDSVARVLETGTLVHGSVERSGENVRVSMRLIDGESGADFQRASFELPLADAQALEDSVATEVSRELRSWLGEEVELRERRAASDNSQAWSLLLRGERARKDGESLLVSDRFEEAWQAFDRADALATDAAAQDPEWVDPLLQRGEIAYRRARVSARDRDEATAFLEAGLAHANAALTLDESSAPSLELRGKLSYLRWLLRMDDDAVQREALLSSARDDLEKAVDRDPSLASAHSVLSHLYYQTDDVSAAVLAAREAYEEDAYLTAASQILWRLYVGSYDLAQFTQARRWCDEGARRFPSEYLFTECQLWLMLVDGAEADVGRAWELSEQLIALVPEPDRPFRRGLAGVLVGGVLARAELPDSADAVIRTARADPAADPDQELAGYEAAIRAISGDTERAIDLLKAYVAANPGHSFEVGGNLHWWWRSLSAHPEFRAVLDRG